MATNMKTIQSHLLSYVVQASQQQIVLYCSVKFVMLHTLLFRLDTTTTAHMNFSI